MSSTAGPAAGSLKILVLGLNYAPETTGIAPYTTGLARYLSRRGHDVAVVAGHPHYPEWRLHPGFEKPRPATRDDGVLLLRVPHPVPRDPTGWSRILMEVSFALRSAGYLVRQRPDVVLAVSPALLTVVPALLLRRAKGFAFGVVVQDLYGAALAETGLGGGLLTRATARLEIALFRRVRHVSVIHDVFRRRLLAAGLEGDDITVIPNWAHVTMPNDTDRAATRKRLGWGDNDFIALHAGNMGAKQGLGGLVDVARLAEQRGSSVRIVLLGNGSQRSALMKYATGASQASFLDSLPDGDFEAALAAADCLLLHEKPGVVEMSVPSKLTTYFTAGRPVVAATDKRSGAASLMTRANAGTIVQAGDAFRLLQAIESMASDTTTANTYGTNGRTFAAAHLTGTQSLSMYETWVHQLAGSRRTRIK